MAFVNMAFVNMAFARMVVGVGVRRAHDYHCICVTMQIQEWLNSITMHEKLVNPAPDEEHSQIAAETFRMLADATRVRILWALFQQELSVNALAEHVGAAPSAVSQHLAKLRLAGLVESRREGTFAYYSAKDSHVRTLLAQALYYAEHVTGTAEDTSGHHGTGY